MIFRDVLVVIRGGGDLATGVAWRLHQAGFALIVTELANPLTVRRAVSLSSAVRDGDFAVSGMIGRRVDDAAEAVEAARSGVVAVMPCPGLPAVAASVVVDARLAKRNLDTRIDDAPMVIALGPGFTAGTDCHAVIETQRGHDLGRVLWHGSPAANTGVPGEVGGHGSARVLRAPTDGSASWVVAIGDVVDNGQHLGMMHGPIGGPIGGAIGGSEIRAPFRGIVRGLIADATSVAAGTKIGDIDPRTDTPCETISDKALAIGGGVLEATLSWLNKRPSSNSST
jgi:xanthine dehydrogenase accessory factor